MPSTSSSSETQQRLTSLIQATRDRQSQNLARLRRNIEAVDSPVEGVEPRQRPTPSRTTMVADEALARSIEQTRIAQARVKLPPVPKGRSDFGSSIIDRVTTRYRGGK